MEKLKISLPIIVEGRYDKSTLSGFIDATIITTGGFSIFNNKEKQALIRRIASNGIILLTDSDGGGKQIRKFLMGILPPDKIHNLYIPKVQGKESRKRKPSASGNLGVEGMEADVIRKLLLPYSGGCRPERAGITKAMLYEYGLSGGDGSAAKRDALAKRFDLPDGMSANALLEAINLLINKETYDELIKTLSESNSDN